LTAAKLRKQEASARSTARSAGRRLSALLRQDCRPSTRFTVVGAAAPTPHPADFVGHLLPQGEKGRGAAARQAIGEAERVAAIGRAELMEGRLMRIVDGR